MFVFKFANAKCLVQLVQNLIGISMLNCYMINLKIVNGFGKKLKLEKGHFGNVIQWWEVGKVQIKIFLSAIFL